MGKTYAQMDGRLRKFIEAQPVFFLAGAPLAEIRAQCEPRLLSAVSRRAAVSTGPPRPGGPCRSRAEPAG